ncbi:MAG TPA: GNAT family N-acetyltransferase [Longimicrobiaceae bacterium]|nr:GNAT family N-acetyltransferase [Longimicrobiaceae bacterium]
MVVPEVAPPFPPTPRVELRLLGPDDAPELQRVFAAAGDYFLGVTGRPEPDADAAERELRGSVAASGRGVALVTLRETGEAVGALGWWAGNPQPDVALLGMLLVVPERRREGLAREALGALEGWLAARGVRRLRTGVAMRDRRAGEVLPALGFARMSIAEHQALGLDMAHLALWEKTLG